MFMGIAVYYWVHSMAICYSQFGQVITKSMHERLNILFPVDYNILKWR